MRIVSVNVGAERTQAKGAELEITGIYKLPAVGPVQITPAGIEQDFIGDHKNHGGPDQAVYVYGTADYDWWSQKLGKKLDAGTFGENLTIADLQSTRLSIGDRIQVGVVRLEVTAPRIPCSTLARRMGDPKFAKTFRDAERPGCYCRVIAPGTVQAGDDVTLASIEGESVTVLEMFREHYRRDKSEATLRRLLRAPIGIRARADLESELQQLLAGRTA